MAFRVLLDACVLLPYQLCDLLLRLAEEEMYEPLWSEEILHEVERNLSTTFRKSPEQAARRVNRMRAAFPFAAVDNYQALTPVMTNHRKDRHVLAAAVCGGAALIVTANLKDFPTEALAKYDIEAIHPDDFLKDQFALDPDRTIRCVAQQRHDYTRPVLTLDDFYRSLYATVPGFADQAAAAERGRFDPEAPLPLEIVSSEQAMEGFFPDGNPDPETPLGAAFLWWTALLDMNTYSAELKQLSYDPADWSDFRSTFDALDGWAMMQNVHYCDNAPDEIAYIKFTPDTGFPMRAFAGAPLQRVQVLTLVSCPDRWWRVWGISENHFPSARRVKRGIAD